MDKECLIRVEQTMKQIRTLLLSDSEIRKLLYYSTSDLGKKNMVDMKEVSIEAVKDNVFLQMVTSIDTTPPFDKRNYIAISLSTGVAGDIMNDYAIKVFVMCEKHDWVYDNDNKVRPMRLLQETLNLIDGKKFACSNELWLNKFNEMITTDDVYGYVAIFGLEDGVSDGTQLQ